MTKHSILIVDDNANLRAGLKVLFEQSDSVSEIHQASNGREAIQVAGRVMPSIILLDDGNADNGRRRSLPTTEGEVAGAESDYAHVP